MSISEEMNDKSNEVRTSEQCKKRWENYLDPKINKNKWGKIRLSSCSRSIPKWGIGGSIL